MSRSQWACAWGLCVLGLTSVVFWGTLERDLEMASSCKWGDPPAVESGDAGKEGQQRCRVAGPLTLQHHLLALP